MSQNITALYNRVMTTEKKISRLCHWMSFLLRMKDFKTIFKKLEKGPPPATFSDPTCPKI